MLKGTQPVIQKEQQKKGYLFVRLFIVLTCVLFGCSGCSTLPDSFVDLPPVSLPESTVSLPEEDTLNFTISYSATDSLSPYATTSRTNLDLAPLLFEGLTAMDMEWDVQTRLASSVTAQDATHIQAVLRTDIRFSDGSALTAADVVASFQLAKESPNYKVLLANVTGAEAQGETTVVFTLTAGDPHYMACLTFPITKQGSALIGSGPYVMQNTPPQLVKNPYYNGTVALETIYLRHLVDNEEMLRGLESGTIHYYFNDLSDGEVPRISNATTSVPLPSLIFLGINSHHKDLSNALVRTALSEAIDRSILCAYAFAGHAQPAVTPFSPNWKPVVEFKGYNTGENVAVAVAQLEQAGYNTRSDTAIENGKDLTLSLLYTGGNSFRREAAQLIKQQLEKTGITVELVDCSFDEYKNRLEDGDFDLYLGEVRLPANMSLSSLLTKGGAASFGIDSNGAGAQAFARYLSGETDLAAFCTAFAGDMPFIPVCYRQGIAAYNRNISQISPHAFNLFYDVGKWHVPSSVLE